LYGIRGSVLRGMVFDHWVAEFLREHPGGTVMDIGVGLNSRSERLDNGTCHWVDLDLNLPDSMALRRRFFTETEHRTMLRESIVDDDWVATVVARPGPYFFVAKAVLIYLSEADARTAVGHVRTHRWSGRATTRATSSPGTRASGYWTARTSDSSLGVRRRPPRSYRMLIPLLKLLPQSRAYRLNFYRT
jgi:O-methyltransferase involved in polyketide biosynthesis